MINKIITSEGNVQFIYGDSGKIINVHPFHVYSVFNVDTVSFLLIAMPKDSGLAIFTTKAEDLEINGETYTFEELPNALSEAFAIAGAQARAEIVDELPETGMTNTIYLVPKEDGHGYDEYIYIKETSTWELIGDTDIELSRYVKKTDFNAYTAQTAAKIDYLSGATDAEVARATSAETALDEKIDGKVIELTQAEYDSLEEVDPKVIYVITDATPVNMADYVKKVDFNSYSAATKTAMDNETSARTNADTAEQTAREAADSFISGAVDTLSTALANEVQRAQNAESGLSEDIEDEMTRAMVIEDALQDAIDAVSGNVETETARAEGVESVLSGAIDAIDAKFIDDAKYEDSGNTKVINFYNGNTIKATIDCSDFIVDGMVDDVRIENGYLVIDFNTASGKQDIQIPLTDIFNPSNYYIKSETSGATEIATALAQKLSISDFNTYSGTIETALNGKADANNVYTKDEVDNAITAATATKQDTLVSSENIKTINNESILGSGNIDIQGGGGTVESAITSGSTNAVQSKALWDELRLGGAGLVETTIEWSGYDSTNYPIGSTEIKLEFTSECDDSIYFYTENDGTLGNVYITYHPQWGDVRVDNTNFEGSSYEISGSTITISYPSVTNVTKLNTRIYNYATVKAIYNDPLIVLKDQVTGNTAAIKTKVDTTTFNSYASSVDSALGGKLNISDYVVDSALNKYSDNPLKNSALFDELRIASGGTGTTDLTITFDGGNSTNYPTDCRQIKVELVNGNSGRLIFRDSEGYDVGDYYFATWGTPDIRNNLTDSTYELSGSTVIISYPNVNNIARLNNEYGTQIISSVAAVMPNYTYVLVVDQVVANTTALGGLKLQQISQSDYDNLPTKDNNTLYVII